MRPGFGAFEIVVVRIETNEVDTELAPDNELIKECFFVGSWRARFFHGESNRQRASIDSRLV
jgi:hypothetical protein